MWKFFSVLVAKKSFKARRKRSAAAQGRLVVLTPRVAGSRTGKNEVVLAKRGEVMHLVLIAIGVMLIVVTREN